ncbi:ROK family transcriptional regulator [Piscinibacter gummiphilus]|uniref:ROK family transcriptional regulator n=1 Tax=Piscinibacter gummiphilus TaxID=946333 RepID=A0ABZ0CZW2_9BURK|nr:ROK family transcriptional regulator [Piscinibacter gummiphilus]WOB10472.1 ROK family transcriptional regulator [Piscinibacter gummiphilus]
MTRLQSRQISLLHLYQVLHTVRLARPAASRAEICQATGLSQPAVSSLTRRLLETGALMEVGARPSTGSGRRERELALNPDFAWVVGVKVSMHQITLALVDFAGGVRDTLKVPISAPVTQAALLQRLVKEIKACLAAADPQVRQRLAGVGVAVPGMVDSLRGEVHWSPLLKPGRKDEAAALAAPLTDALGVPVMIENDANMLALAEQWFGQAARLSNVAVVTLEHGLGLGLVLDGELFRGHSGLAAEFGHIQVVPGGRACRCGKQGCLEAYVAHSAVVGQGQEAGLLPGGELGSGEIETAYVELAAQARAGNRRARQIFEQQGELLGRWMGNMVNLLAPQLVMLDGMEEGTELFLGSLQRAMNEALALPHRQRELLVVHHRGDETWARGAASLVLQRLDESAEILESVSRHGFETEPDGPRPVT